jgi:hypothetical protein
VRDPRISKAATGYGQVAQLKDNERPDMNLLWIAPSGSVTTPFIPYRIGTTMIFATVWQAPQLDQGRSNPVYHSGLADTGSYRVCW